MKKNNRRRTWIIVFAAAAVIVPLLVLLLCSGIQTGSAAPKEQERKAVQKEGQQKTEPESRRSEQKKTEKRDTAQEKQKNAQKQEKQVKPEEVLPSQNTECMEQEETSVHSETRQPKAGGAAVPDREAIAQPAQEVHLHSFALSGTRKVEHPAVTKQVWVEDSAAWDEVVRAGYHVSVVTCHECGAKFSDPAQANALEAWGDHIDAAHNGDGGYDMAASYDVPAEIKHHEAKGHYETQTVTAAWCEYIDTYRCPCGEQYTKTR